MKAIPWEVQHQLVVTDIDKKKLKKVVKNEQTVRRRVWKQDFKKELRNWLMLMHLIYGRILKTVYYKLVMKYVERRKVGGTIKIRGGGMKK